jgi:translation elongation factor EF-Tu-like GTPase
MDTNLPDIEAVIVFLRTEDGGKTRPVRSGYRPQFYYDGEDWDAEHKYPGVEQVMPGDTVTATLTFTRPHLHLGRVRVGTEFLLREGAKTVGSGRVTRLLNLAQNAERMRALETARRPNNEVTST